MSCVTVSLLHLRALSQALESQVKRCFAHLSSHRVALTAHCAHCSQLGSPPIVQPHQPPPCPRSFFFSLRSAPDAPKLLRQQQHVLTRSWAAQMLLMSEKRGFASLDAWGSLPRSCPFQSVGLDSKHSSLARLKCPNEQPLLNLSFAQPPSLPR